MKNQLNRELIVGLSESNNAEFVENVNDVVFNLVSASVGDISEKSPFIRAEKCILQPANEIYTGGFAQLSQYTYILGIDNKQIELNSKTRKNHWKTIWREFRASWRLGRKKYKKEKKTLSVQPVDKYKLSDFRHDLTRKFCEYLSETTMITEYSDHISLVGKEDFGSAVKVNIYICCYDFEKNDFKLYNESKNKYFTFNFGERFLNLDTKVKDCGDMYIEMIKIFNALYSKAYNKIPNQIMLESLLFNCPKVLFNKKDIYQTFVNVANYIRIAFPKSFVSICDNKKTVFEDQLVTRTGSQVDYGKIINMLDNYKY